MRFALSILASACLLLAVPALAFPDGNGIDSSGCSPCHAGATGSLVVTVTGPASLAPGASQNYFVSIPPTLVGAGLAVELAGGGALDAVAAGTQVNGGIVSHTMRNDGVYGYDVEVTAPVTEGLITLDVAILAYDDANGADGDEWNTGTMDITVEVPEPGQALMVLVGLLPLAARVAQRRRVAACRGRLRRD
jgi:hypothetical protein